MKKLFSIFILLVFSGFGQSQELLANVQINYQQLGGSNVQTYKTLEKSLKDFINNTSWTGKRLQNFEKIKTNLAIVISEKTGNTYKASIVVQATRPIFNSQYDSPLINFNDNNFSFEYSENENLVFNERQFSGKNLIDVISFYVYTILGYDGDSFKLKGGQTFFDKALKISQNSMNNNYAGWSQVEGLKSRGALIDAIQKETNSTLRSVYYNYHRIGLDNLAKTDQGPAKKNIADALMQLKVYENDFQMNPAFNVFLDTKKAEIFNIFDSNNNGGVNMNDLKQLMSTFAPNDIDSKWNKWK